MKAFLYEIFGPPDVFQLKNVDKPLPKKNEVLIKIFATTVTSADCRLRSCQHCNEVVNMSSLCPPLSDSSQSIDRDNPTSYKA